MNQETPVLLKLTLFLQDCSSLKESQRTIRDNNRFRDIVAQLCFSGRVSSDLAVTTRRASNGKRGGIQICRTRGVAAECNKLVDSWIKIENAPGVTCGWFTPAQERRQRILSLHR